MSLAAITILFFITSSWKVLTLVPTWKLAGGREGGRRDEGERRETERWRQSKKTDMKR